MNCARLCAAVRQVITVLLFAVPPFTWCTQEARAEQPGRADTPRQASRARALGVPFDGTPGPLNAITDVAGVTVGHTTLIFGEGPLKVGVGPVRTGVTAILPRPKDEIELPVFAAWYSLNGNGEMTGTTWIEESGLLEGPIAITNTHSVGVVRDALIQWRLARLPHGAAEKWWALPVVAETFDGWLNDINGLHVNSQHVFRALENASAGTVEEGSVGGGTGMICNGFKGGVGTASRQLAQQSGGYRVGVLVQCNYGLKANLRIAGVPIGREVRIASEQASMPSIAEELGSIVVVVATDAPLMPHQLKRLARRVPLALGRTGTSSSNGSGDIFLAFSTANSKPLIADANPGASPNAVGASAPQAIEIRSLPNRFLNPIFDATVEATEEAIINAMVAADDMTGRDDHHVAALPHDQLQAVLKRYGRLAD